MRINTLVSLIEQKKNIIVDVGSDHAYLSKQIIDNDLANKVINLEKNDGPLKNGINNTSAKKYLSRIDNLKSDGLQMLDPSLLIDICFICGMGGKTIVEILDKALDKNVQEYILQPNNSEEEIRRWAKKHFWKIKKEMVIVDNHKFYEIIYLSKKEGYHPFFKKDIIFGKQNIKSRESVFYDKWNDYFKAHTKVIESKKNKKLNKSYRMYLKVAKNESN